MAVMKLCLDTNAYVWFKRGNKELTQLLEQADEIFLSSVVLGELYAGFFMGTREKQNRDELQLFLDLPGVSLYPVDHGVTERYGRLVCLLKKQGTHVPTNDIWIAATAFETGSRLVTLDKHFNRVPGLVILYEKFGLTQ